MSSKILLVASLVAVLFLLSGCPAPEGADDAGVDRSPAPAPAPATTTAALDPDAGEVDYKCPVCGMDSSMSPTMVQEGEVYFDGLGDWAKYSGKGGIDLTGVMMVDFSTNEGERSMIPIEGAFLVEADSLKMTMPPFFVAFASEDEAGKYASENEGEMMSLESVVERLQSIAEAADGGGSADDEHEHCKKQGHEH